MAETGVVYQDNWYGYLFLLDESAEYMYVGYYASTAPTPVGAAMIFNFANVGNSASISSATLTITLTASWSNGHNIEVYGDADGDAEEILQGNTVPPDRTLTTEYLDEEVAAASAGDTVEFDVTDIVQEIVNDTGYAEDTNLAIFLMSDGTEQKGDGSFSVATKENVTYDGPELSITLAGGGGSTRQAIHSGSAGVLMF